MGTPRNAERERLAEAARGEHPWKKWGPYLSERQWGTVRENSRAASRPGTTSRHDQARSRAYLSGEDGIAGFSDDQLLLCFARRAVERTRSDPQGAPLRPDQQRGQPRRGRQGVLLLPRQHADPRVREDALQVSAGGVPVRASWSTENRRRSRSESRVRADRHRRLRRGPLLGRLRRVRQGGPGGHPDPHHRRQPRARAATLHALAAPLVPQHLVGGPTARRGPSWRPPPPAAPR